MSTMNEVNMAKVPVFSGKKSDFPMWWSKFKAVAAQRKFAKAITETGEGLPTSSNDKIDESTVKGKATIKKIERNDLAMAAFTMAFQTQKLMNMLNKAKAPEWENSKAHEVTKLLLKRYKQDDAINKAEMTKELINVKLAESDDPSELFEEMYRIKNMYETKTNVVADSVLIPFVLSAAPAKYHAIITSEMRDKEENLTLFSITRRLRQGFQLGGDKNCIWLEKSGKKIVFDIVIPTPKGAIYCAYLKRKNVEVASASKANKLISVNLAHQIFGHGDEASTRKTAKALGFDLKQGTMKPCVSCSVAKAKQKNLPSHGEHVLSAESNGRVFLDLSTVKPPGHLNVRVTKPHWRIIVDERTQLKVSDFFETKNGMVEPTCELFYKW